MSKDKKVDENTSDDGYIAKVLRDIEKYTKDPKNWEQNKRFVHIIKEKGG